jgi:hypothetical protein
VWAVCERAGTRRSIRLPDLGHFEADLDSGGITTVELVETDPALARRRFWKEVVPMLHQANGALCLHASAVAAGGGAVLLVGATTAGKSSLARAWSELGGVEQLADDVAVIYPGEAGAHLLHPLPFHASVRGEMRQLLEQPDLEVDEPGSVLPVRALVFVEPTPTGRPSLSAVGAAALPIALSESCCFTIDDPESRVRFYGANLDLLESLPCRRLLYPQRLDRLGATLSLLEGLADRLEAVPTL